MAFIHVSHININLILNVCELEDGHINVFIIYFSNLVKATFPKYAPVHTREIRSSRYSEVPAQNKHIQLLCRHVYHVDTIGKHWICTYYDKKDLFIFDSFNLRELDPDYRKALQILHPFLFCNNDADKIYFRDVQHQNNAEDSAVLAIAFATSVLLGTKPNRINYIMDALRPHLIETLEKKVIKHVPFVFKPTPPHLLRRYPQDINNLI